MANILDYISWRGDLSFSASPFNDIDALVLCQISYIDFDGLLPAEDFSASTTLSDLCDLFKNSPDLERRSDLGVLINKKSVDLLFAAASSVRFGNLKVTGYSSIIEPAIEEQFSAMTFLLPEKMNFVAYRGTDDTIVGWKEDFNLAIMDEVPAQSDAVRYLETAAASLKGSFIVGGHSKGGNLAVYAGAVASASVKKRVSVIYNLDGPGFSEKTLSSDNFYEAIPKIRSYYPHFSIVGMLFGHAGEYSVVESDETGIMQHDPFSWHLNGTTYTTLEGFDSGSVFFHETFNAWISNISDEQRSKFIEALFTLIQATDARTNSEIEKNLLRNSVKIIKAVGSLDGEMRKALKETISILFKTAHKQLPVFSGMETDAKENSKSALKSENKENKEREV